MRRDFRQSVAWAVLKWPLLLTPVVAFYAWGNVYALRLVQLFCPLAFVLMFLALVFLLADFLWLADCAGVPLKAWMPPAGLTSGFLGCVAALVAVRATFYNCSPEVESFCRKKTIKVDSYGRSVHFLAPVGLTLMWLLVIGGQKLLNAHRQEQPARAEAKSDEPPVPVVAPQEQGLAVPAADAQDVPNGRAEEKVAEKPSARPRRANSTRTESTPVPPPPENAAIAPPPPASQRITVPLDNVPVVRLVPANINRQEARSEDMVQAGPSDWRVRPDPAADLAEIQPRKKLTIPFPRQLQFGGSVLFPSSPSRYVALVGGAGTEVYSIESGGRAGRLAGATSRSPYTRALSADGQYLAVVSRQGQFPYLELWSVRHEKGVWRSDLNPIEPDVISFAGPGHVLAIETRGQLVQYWSVETGRRERTIQVKLRFARDAIAVSHGGKYVAIGSTEDDAIRLFDLATGEVAGTFLFPKREGTGFGIHACGATFSADGNELAVAYEKNGMGYVFVILLADGSVTQTVRCDQTLKELVDEHGYQGPALEWLPDKSGWLVYGNGILDRKTGKLCVRFPRDALQSQPRRILDSDHVVSVFYTANRQMALQVVPIPAGHADNN